MDSVRFDRVSLMLGGQPVLTDVSIQIGAAEFVGVLGANGAGKTTLFRAILGLVPPASGRIEVLGGLARRGHSGIGYMPQSRAPAAGRLSGRDLLLAAVDGHRWGWVPATRARRREVDRVLSLTRSTDLADRLLGEMSGGERQRLLLAQALLGAPKLLLLDEPLSSLDPNRQAGLVALIQDIQRELRIPVLFSAHDLNPLLGVMNRVMYLGGGHAALGTVAEVITAPVLSRLYGAPIDVLHLNGRIFVIAGDKRLDLAGACAGTCC